MSNCAFVYEVAPPTASLFKKTLGTVVATVTIPTGAARGSIQVFHFGKDMGHRGGKKMKYVCVCVCVCV